MYIYVCSTSGGGGYCDIFKIHRLGRFFLAQNFVFQYFFLLKKKTQQTNNWGGVGGCVDFFVDILLGSHLDWTFLWVISKVLR